MPKNKNVDEGIEEVQGIPCPDCNGTGIAEDGECERCNGTGTEPIIEEKE